jgi:hypothetical protein
MKLEDSKIEISFNMEEQKVVVTYTSKFDRMTEAQEFIDRLKVFIQGEITNGKSKSAETD